MDDEKPTFQREQNVNQQGSMQEIVQEASMLPEMQSVVDAERSGDGAAETSTLGALKNKLADIINAIKADFEVLKNLAESRGEQAPSMPSGVEVSPKTAKDVAEAIPAVEMARQEVGAKMTSETARSAGEAVMGIAGLGLVLKEAQEGNLGQLAYNANLPDQQKDSGISAMLS